MEFMYLSGPYAKQGCKFSGKRKEEKAHLDVCIYEQLKPVLVRTYMSQLMNVGRSANVEIEIGIDELLECRDAEAATMARGCTAADFGVPERSVGLTSFRNCNSVLLL
jgi:hypothetical protein